MTEDQLVRAVADVIAKRAGWYKQVRKGLPQPLARQLNNPGLLTSWRKYDRRGNSEEYPTSHGYVEFPTIDDGWKALWKHTRIRINPNDNAIRRGSKPASARDLFRGRDDGEYLEMVTRLLHIHPQEALITLIGGRTCPTIRMNLQTTGLINSTN